MQSTQPELANEGDFCFDDFLFVIYFKMEYSELHAELKILFS